MKTSSIFFTLVLVILLSVCHSGAQGNSYNGLNNAAQNGGNITGTFTGNGGGLTNLAFPSFNPNAVSWNNNWLGYDSVELATNNSSQLTLNGNPTLQWFTNTSPVSGWTSYGFQSLSNQIQTYGFWPTNKLAFGSVPAIWFYQQEVQQAQMLKFRMHVLGKQVLIYASDGAFFYTGDEQFTQQKNWQFFQHHVAGDPMYYMFTWPNFAVHNFEIEFDQGLPISFSVPATNCIFSGVSTKITVAVSGDSISEGNTSPNNPPHNTWVAQLQDLLEPYGISLVNMSEGGTGYTNNGVGAGTTNFFFRLTNDIAFCKPNAVLWAGGLDDVVSNYSTFSAATNCFGWTKANMSGVKQLVIAPWSGLSGSGDTAGLNQCISNAAAVYSLPIIFPDYTSNVDWITGVVTSPGSGTAPTFGDIYASGPHVNALGGQYYANMVANFVLTNLMTNATPIIWP